jgi:hypothetical protein
MDILAGPRSGGVSGKTKLHATKMSVIALMHFNVSQCARRHSPRGDGRREPPPSHARRTARVSWVDALSDHRTHECHAA